MNPDRGTGDYTCGSATLRVGIARAISMGMSDNTVWASEYGRVTRIIESISKQIDSLSDDERGTADAQRIIKALDKLRSAAPEWKAAHHDDEPADLIAAAERL